MPVNKLLVLFSLGCAAISLATKDYQDAAVALLSACFWKLDVIEDCIRIRGEE